MKNFDLDKSTQCTRLKVERLRVDRVSHVMEFRMFGVRVH